MTLRIRYPLFASVAGQCAAMAAGHRELPVLQTLRTDVLWAADCLAAPLRSALA